jgi:hypothetical protein
VEGGVLHTERDGEDTPQRKLLDPLEPRHAGLQLTFLLQA